MKINSPRYGSCYWNDCFLHPGGATAQGQRAGKPRTYKMLGALHCAGFTFLSKGSMSDKWDPTGPSDLLENPTTPCEDWERACRETSPLQAALGSPVGRALRVLCIRAV